MTTPDRTEETYVMHGDTWFDTAQQYARNADYWRERAERAERFTIQRAWWAFRRWVRNHVTARP